VSVRQKLSTTRYQGEIDFSIEEHSAEQVVATMPVNLGIMNPFGTIHAGAMIWFADVAATLCAIGDLDHIDDEGRGFPLAIDLHTVLVGNQGEGELKAVARPVRRGSRVTVIRTEVTGNQGRLLIDMTTTHVPAR
jgi:uncharacterized protein (TIGR00369 family)